MLAGALGTYAATLFAVAASTAIGAGILAAAGRREWSWTAPAIGLAAATMIAWWFVRLPGEGLTALLAVAVASIGGGALAATRLGRLGEALRRGLPTLLVALAAVSIPFAAEGQFGILGTGFNVDMSQHLFTADWLADPVAAPPELFQQGYPLGPHALAVATGEIGGELATSFTGVTIAVPVIMALTALAGLKRLPTGRATIAALLCGLAYLSASYLAQGSFKELFEAAFLLGFALVLVELGRPGGDRGARAGVALGVIAAGSLYAYSGPGLLWLAGAAGFWAAIELVHRRDALASTLRAALPAAAVALAVTVVLAAPELGRIADFGTSAGSVATATAAQREPNEGKARDAGPAGRDRAGLADGQLTEEDFDNSLGNLFGQIQAIEAFGIWPSGDFRVSPGGGSVPAFAFYLGALLGALALLLGSVRALRERETALVAALVAAGSIYLAARTASTPYTAAKALQMLAPLAGLIAARGALEWAPRGRPAGLPAIGAAAFALAFCLAAAASSLLALASAPIGPGRYTAGVAKAREQVAGSAVLLLAPRPQITDRHGRDYYLWELRGARPGCVAVLPADGSFETPAPEGIDFVITVSERRLPPFEGLEPVQRRDGVSLFEVGSPQGPAAAAPVDPGAPTDCGLGLPEQP